MANENVDDAMRAAMVMHQAGRLADAERAYRQMLSADPNYAHAWHLLGVLMLQTNRLPQAVETLAKSIALGMGADAQINLGDGLRAMNRFEEAIAAYSAAIDQNPGDSKAHSALGAVLLQAGRFEDAQGRLMRATDLDPKHTEAWGNLGVAELSLGDPRAAARAYEQAVALRPDIVEFTVQLSGCYYLLRKLDEALAAIDRALPRHPSLHYQRSMILLAQGNYVEGFTEYEWRARAATSKSRPRQIDRPMWDGSDPTGRTVLIHAEQGYGDVIQFARYIPMLAARGAKVIVEVLWDLRDLIASVHPQVRVISAGLGLPDFDLHVPLMSLPRIFGTTLDSVPANIPYLRPSGDRVKKWTPMVQAPSGQRKIGLVWGGKRVPDPRRSIPLARLAPLAQVPAITWFGLQTGEPRAELASAPTPFNLIDLGKNLKDFSDTAAVMSQLDLVITIDTAAAHLAGGLGVDTWTLLPYAPDWRWRMEGESTPWYPRMRLFRQSAIDRWDDVIEQVGRALHACQ